MSNQIFEHLGYHIDYWVNSKYVGFIKTDEADRETFGYTGRQAVTLSEPTQITRSGGKQVILPAGCQVVTECIPLCGRVIGDWKQRIETLKQHYQSAPYKRRFK